MGCGCGSSATSTAQAQANRTYVHTSPEGERKTYKSEVEAAAAQQRLGGTYRAQ
jgi:hypothetical protein